MWRAVVSLQGVAVPSLEEDGDIRQGLNDLLTLSEEREGGEAAPATKAEQEPEDELEAEVEQPEDGMVGAGIPPDGFEWGEVF